MKSLICSVGTTAPNTGSAEPCMVNVSDSVGAPSEKMNLANLEPVHWAPDISQPEEKAVSLHQTCQSHSQLPATLIPRVDGLDSLVPERKGRLRNSCRKAQLADHATPDFVDYKIGSFRVAAPTVIERRQLSLGIPAAFLPRCTRLRVHGSTERQEPQDLDQVNVSALVAPLRWRKGLSGAAHTLSGASRAMRTTIHPPWLVPRANAFLTWRASMTCSAMMAVSQYVNCSETELVAPCPSGSMARRLAASVKVWFSNWPL